MPKATPYLALSVGQSRCTQLPLMAFQKVTKPFFAPRKWALVGYANDGKSTFLMQMRRPLLVIDADQRIDGTVKDTDEDVFRLGDEPKDANDVNRIEFLMKRDMPGAGVQTIGIDSLTGIIGPIINKAMAINGAGASKNKSSPFVEKATAMRILQDAVTPWGADLLFIWHLEGNTMNGVRGTRESLPETERDRLRRSLNAELQVIWDGDRRGIKVVWTREGTAGAELFDTVGNWKSMPERIEIAIYGFTSREKALDWAVERGDFASTAEALAAYDKLRKDVNPKTAPEMWRAWGDRVLFGEPVSA